MKDCNTCKTIYYDYGDPTPGSEPGVGLVCTGVLNTPTPLMGEIVENCKIWTDRRSDEERRSGKEYTYTTDLNGAPTRYWKVAVNTSGIWDDNRTTDRRNDASPKPN